MANIVIMPKQGLQMTAGTITKWLIEEGKEVKEGDALFEMETDKLSITIDSSFTGTLLKIIRHEGEEVPITEPIAVIGEPGEDISGLSFSAAAEEKKEEVAVKEEEVKVEQKEEPKHVSEPETKPAEIPDNGRILITPRAKMRCAERNISDYSKIKGTGDNGLIVERDVLSYNIPQTACSAYSVVSIIVDMSSAALFIKNLGEDSNGFGMSELFERAIKAASKKTGCFDSVTVKDLLETTVCEYIPALDHGNATIAAAGIFNKEGKPTSKISMVFDSSVNEKDAAEFLVSVGRMIENPLLMLAL